jgi:hypothetical protein
VLPGELVTSDDTDESKAHELDAPHVVKSIVKDFGRGVEEAARPTQETAKTVAKKLWAPGPGERAPVRQWFVDVARMRVYAVMVANALDAYNAGREPDLSVHYLWFENNNVNDYSLRRGNPPPRKDRPKHLRDIDLVVDVMEPPRSIVAELAKRGVELDVKKLLRQAERERSAIVTW